MRIVINAGHCLHETFLVNYTNNHWFNRSKPVNI